MLRRLSTTPCPNGTWRRQEIQSDDTGELTANVEFTTAFQPSLRGVKPRRPPRPTKAPNIGFTIHEEEELRLDDSRPNQDSLPASTKHRPFDDASDKMRRVSFSLDLAVADSGSSSVRPSGLSKAPRRQSIKLGPSTEHSTNSEAPSRITRPARRGTIFIPNDDTTMPTMFMDIFSPLKKQEADATNDKVVNNDLTGLALQMVQKRGRRASLLAGSPKRAPLSINKRPTQPSIISNDRPGDGPGKENIPPGIDSKTMKIHKASLTSQRSVGHTKRHDVRRLSHLKPLSSRLLEPTASSMSRTTQTKRKEPTPKTDWNSNFLLPKPKPESNDGHIFDQTSHDQSLEPRVANQPQVPSRFVIPTIQTVQHEAYALVPEGVVDASMYENNWLGQQEIAITQLINNLFNAAALNGTNDSPADLDRLRMLEIYGSQDMSLLYKRLQGCLAHGPLSLAGEGRTRRQQLEGDVAKRKGYVQFWLKTYNARLLRTALEVVVGRVVPLRSSRRASNDHSIDSQTRSPGPLQRFIEKFLMRNEDDCSNACDDVLYQRTVLRSLMLIKLLDIMKTNPNLSSSAMLFRRESIWKTSSAAAWEMLRMLNPNVGDVARPLQNIGYVVTHEQYPLQEFRYNVENLAVDIRDGVRLTRLVELLLYRGASRSLSYAQDLDATTNINIPGGLTVCLADGNQDWPISQHLRIPCDSRATKLYNVELALAALNEVKGINGYLREVTAADIVDGFREKTVHLLWLLFSKHGLGGLLDWSDIKSEIQRLGRLQGKVGSAYLAGFDVEDDADDQYVYFKSLLRAWVKAVAASQGIRVRNFTTDFADGRIFSAIVSGYEAYMPSVTKPATGAALSQRLKHLGCSSDFANLFTPPSRYGEQQQQIFDRDFVLASVAFLASRLLRPTKATRAAIIIQRAWRRRFQRILSKRKAVLRVLATTCAQFKIASDAKKTIWRAWRVYKGRKAERMVSRHSAQDEDVWLSL